LLQTADILLYQPKYVPVGQDQAAHVEITREVARRFNSLYPGRFSMPSEAAPWELEAVKTKARKIAGEPGKDTFSTHEMVQAAHQTKLKSSYLVEEILPVPEVLLTPTPKLPGTDGRKMSKSYGNTIFLSDEESIVRSKLKTMVTDPERVRRTDPGNPEVCPVFDLHKVFSSEQTQAEARSGCVSAGIGCIECKSWLADAVVERLRPIQERRRYYEARPGEVTAIFEAGAVRARERAAKTMAEVRRVVGLRG
jgi:tryptophanyl-tRNA synthetase